MAYLSCKVTQRGKTEWQWGMQTTVDSIGTAFGQVFYAALAPHLLGGVVAVRKIRSTPSISAV